MDVKLGNRLRRVVKQALDAGATVSDCAQIVAPLVSRSVFYEWVKKEREAGRL